MKRLFILTGIVLLHSTIYAQDPAYPPVPAAPGNITSVEYFFDTDPGFGKGIAVTVIPAPDIVNAGFSANITSLSNGYHVLYIRSKDDWSITLVDSFLKGSPLPLQLLTFSGLRSPGGIQLIWKTAHEFNTSHFNIERSSNGSAFLKVGEMQAKNSGGKNEYVFMDVQPLNGINFYRLKQTDKDGKFTYSPVVKITNKERRLLLTLFPNPASDLLNIVYTGDKQILALGIYDLQGRLLRQEKVKNESPIKVELQQLEPGLYVIELADGEMVQKTRFLKQ